MDIEYKGGNCIAITIKKNTIFVDPKLSELGLKDQGANAAVQLATQPNFVAPHSEDTVVIVGPGEYEVANVSIHGIPVRAHMDEESAPKRATMYSVTAEDISIAIVGHIHSDLSEEQLEQLGIIDVLVVPVGGNGYTLDATGAVEVIRKIDPKIVIPTHYAEEGIHYPVPQAGIDGFLKEIGSTAVISSKLKLKSGTLGDTLSVQQLSRVA